MLKGVHLTLMIGPGVAVPAPKPVVDALLSVQVTSGKEKSGFQLTFGVSKKSQLLTTMLPAFMLSGMVFDISAMPAWLRVITYLVPARYLVSILQTLFLAGDVWPVLLPNLAALAVAATLAVTGTVLVTRRRLD